jgi:hypothetical protein
VKPRFENFFAAMKSISTDGSTEIGLTDCPNSTLSIPARSKWTYESPLSHFDDYAFPRVCINDGQRSELPAIL